MAEEFIYKIGVDATPDQLVREAERILSIVEARFVLLKNRMGNMKRRRDLLNKIEGRIRNENNPDKKRSLQQDVEDLEKKIQIDFKQFKKAFPKR